MAEKEQALRLSKAFDSVMRPLIPSAYHPSCMEAGGAPRWQGGWLLELDRDDHLMVRTSLATEV